MKEMKRQSLHMKKRQIMHTPKKVMIKSKSIRNPPVIKSKVALYV